MTIPDKYRSIIITSLKYSIFHVREYHQKIASMQFPRKWEYDYEKNSVEPIQDALAAVKNTIKTKKK